MTQQVADVYIYIYINVCIYVCMHVCTYTYEIPLALLIKEKRPVIGSRGAWKESEGEKL